ncbi:MAG: type II secretion system protein [Candidatus Methylacidiphilales bacterium]|nr:type II secretion system protein [Candidatus Methylacidiphilales bacterium]
MKTRSRSHPAKNNTSAFTLIELLVVVVIIGLLAALVVPALNKAQKKAAETKSVAVMRAVLAANSLYAGENNGQIVTIRWDTDSLTNPYVSASFWGRLQPYLFPEITTTNQAQLSTQIKSKLNTLFGTDVSSMKGTPFYGPKLYGDKSGLPVPFATNSYLYEFTKPAENDGWIRIQQIYSAPSTIYLTYGYAMFDEADAETYVDLPKNNARPTNNIFYLPSRRTIAGFLDGRVEYLTPPIAEKMVFIDGSSQ